MQTHHTKDNLRHHDEPAPFYRTFALKNSMFSFKPIPHSSSGLSSSTPLISSSLPIDIDAFHRDR